MKVIPKLSTFNNAQVAETGQMVYANNIRINKIGNICRDYPILKIANHDTIIESCVANYKALSSSEKSRYGYYDDTVIRVALSNIKTIQTIIPYNKELYIFYYTVVGFNLVNYNPDKATNKFTFIPVNLLQVDPNIKGIITLNNTGDRILTLCNGDLQHINLTKCTCSDDVSLYTQSPKIPIINLLYTNKYINTIPNGTYEFFIRYEINTDRYTNWIPCSQRCFAGSRTCTNKTLVGSIWYIDTNKDSGESFIFYVDKAYLPKKITYKRFQIGFLLHHDDDTVARAWKKFDLDTEYIYFSYEEEDITEIEINDLLNPIYKVNGVENITYYKNKLYISNYKETNFNPDLQSYADKVVVNLAKSTSKNNLNITTQSNETSNYSNNVVTLADTGLLTYTFWSNLTKQTIKTINNEEIPLIVAQILYDIKTNKTGFTIDGNTTNALYYYDGITCSISTIETAIKEDTHTQTIRYYKEDATEYEYDDIQVSHKIEFNACLYQEGSRLFRYDGSGADDGVLGGDDIPYNNDIASKIYFKYCYKYADDTADNKYLHRIVCVDFGYTTKGYAVKPEGITGSSGGSSGGGSSSGGSGGNSGTDNPGDNGTDTPDVVQTINDVNTLLPFQYYKFYIHFVSDYGEITNGYPLNDNKAVSYSPTFISEILELYNIHPVIYPKFTNIEIPNGYIACFISILHYKNKTFEYFQNELNSTSSDKYGFDCIELDSRLLCVNSIKIDDEVIEYHPSFDSNVLKLYGMSGKLGDGISGKGKGFFNIDYINTSQNPTLVKCTPYITKTSYTSSTFLDLLGYVCEVRKPEILLTEFIDGGEILNKAVRNNTLYVSSKNKTDANAENIYGYRTTKTNTIYSNYNLNYLALGAGITIKQAIKSIASNDSRVVKYLNSNELSDVYQMPSMYNNKFGKTYEVYNSTNNKYKFDNTIRSSKLIGDEERIYIYTFDATDYYNVPANKGIITNLVAVGDSILVHTEGSLFKFSGTNSLMASGGEDVQTKESDVFDTGISEVFGSINGFGGLKDSKYSCVTYNGYFWFDSDSKRIYVYSGNGQLSIISDQIENIINDADYVLFADDFYNDRIFITTGDYTISYNTKIKSFVSYHDFIFRHSYTTKTNCYFTNNTTDIYTISNFYNYAPYKNELYTKCKSTAYKSTAATTGNASVIDIICKEDYENIKELQAVDWNCYAKGAADKNLLDFYNNTIFDYYTYGGDKIKIYSNQSHTDYVDIPNLSQSYNNRNDINTRNYYQYPYSYKGKWCWNYFTSVKLNDDFKYADKLANTNSIRADNKTTLYGNYFVVRFIFEPVGYLSNSDNFDFEFENINFYTNKVL